MYLLFVKSNTVIVLIVRLRDLNVDTQLIEKIPRGRTKNKK